MLQENDKELIKMAVPFFLIAGTLIAVPTVIFLAALKYLLF